MNQKVTIDGLAEAVEKILDQYGQDALDAIDEAATIVGKQTVKRLRATSPKRSGDYSRGWRTKKETRRLSKNVIVHNKKRYMLTHLLEKGHVTRSGGRVAGRPHIAPAEHEAIEDFKTKLEGKLNDI